jgi:hypothetical protein
MLAMFGFILGANELWIHHIKREWWMLEFAQNWPSIEVGE